MKILKVILCIGIMSFISNVYTKEINDKKIVGIYENVVLLPNGIELPAKLDTGADISSIHGENIDIFERDGKKYIKFLFKWYKNGIKRQFTLEKPLIRYMHVKRKGGLKADRRPVVNIDFCIDGKKYTSEFSIADRRKFSYPLLLGREFLRKHFIIDPDKEFVINNATCKEFIKNKK